MLDRETIIRLALEAKASIKTDGKGVRVFADGLDLERFAALVAAAEREACAKVCEGVMWSDSKEWAADFAAAIRARSTT